VQPLVLGQRLYCNENNCETLALDVAKLDEKYI
jgi:hypothetical protein